MTALVTGVVVAATAGVFGVGGAVLAARREHEHWLRQMRFEVYREFATVVGEVLVAGVALREVTNRLDEDAGGPRQLTREEGLAWAEAALMQPIRRVLQAGAAVRLVGHPELDALVQTLERHAIDAVTADPSDRATGGHALLMRFLEKARGHLHTPPPLVRRSAPGGS